MIMGQESNLFDPGAYLEGFNRTEIHTRSGDVLQGVASTLVVFLSPQVNLIDTDFV
eukprot:CAMPEP_0115037298 /NCGR_PEP_ID=MMETSP0216-20121206/42706_1 /TAXON_ID=223996 /ORGANISM="Protocruzia adherens, Strain Boccale" /LENGTH=55 /DNA_ID=CAMNT_0002417433 /DNA_START=325 /DNA_END=489 /DNA_ORIENTATION=-